MIDVEPPLTIFICLLFYILNSAVKNLTSPLATAREVTIQPCLTIFSTSKQMWMKKFVLPKGEASLKYITININVANKILHLFLLCSS